MPDPTSEADIAIASSSRESLAAGSQLAPKFRARGHHVTLARCRSRLPRASDDAGASLGVTSWFGWYHPSAATKVTANRELLGALPTGTLSVPGPLVLAMEVDDGPRVAGHGRRARSRSQVRGWIARLLRAHFEPSDLARFADELATLVEGRPRAST